MGDKSEKERSAAKKEALKAEAKKLGIPYKELKAQRKEEKEKKRKSREANALKSDVDVNHNGEMKRMRAWSKDFDADGTVKKGKAEAGGEGPAEKRRRTRSMDLAEHADKKPPVDKLPTVVEDAPKTTAEWRKHHNITIRGHGKNTGSKDIAEPFLEFDDAPFCDSIQRSLKAAGFASPTAIQSQAWPLAVDGKDLICVAKTGSGKTCGFLLPALHDFVKSGGRPKNQRPMDMANNGPMLLVVAPTRELAVQIMEESVKFGRAAGARSICCYGGSNKYPQIAAFQRGIEIVIATPGRLNDLLEMGKANLSRVKFLVLDEADRMLDMGFEPQIRSIVAQVPDKRQTLLFSATWPKEIQRLAHDFLTDPIQINVGEVDALVANKDITQKIHMMREDEKPDKLKEILTDLIKVAEDEGVVEEPAPGALRRPVDLGGKKHAKVIVFVAKKINCHELANQLWSDGFAVDSLHGDRAQWERTKVINAFKDGTLRMLIATDVAARGLDVKGIGVVINYDMPGGVNGVEDYVHRIGRTGRAGAKGVAHTFFCGSKDRKSATQLVEVLGKSDQEIPPELQAMARPRFGGRGGGRGRGRGGGRGFRSYGGGGGRGRGYMGGGGGRGGRGRGRW